MGHKKRNSVPRSNRQSSASTTSTAVVVATDGADCSITVEDEKSLNLGLINDSRDEQSKNEVSSQSDSSMNALIKVECEKALTALRRGNHTKALRLMKDSTLRYESSALLFRVQGTLCVKVAALIDDPNVKQRHIKNALESSRRAVSLSPNSIEFGHFYANLLYESVNDGKGYAEVIQECDRALSIESPVDPGTESLQDESQQKLSTPEAWINHVIEELCSLVQKANIASISSWMKNFGNINGEGKFQLIPMRRLTEDPMELRLVQNKRPNELKKATKTPEERRKEIEVRVAAARLLQQKADSPSLQKDDDRSLDSSSGNHKAGERRKHSNLRKTVSMSERMDQVKSFWNSLSLDRKQSMLQVLVKDLKSHFSLPKDSLIAEVVSEALLFAGVSKTWKFWQCCCCSEKFSDGDSHMQHFVRDHMGSLSPRFQSVLPQEVESDWVEMLLSGSWKPIDASSALNIIEEQFKCRSPNVVDGSNNINYHDWSKTGITDSYCREAWDSSPDDENVLPMDEDLEAGYCSGSFKESRRQDDIPNFEIMEGDSSRLVKACLKKQTWPLCDDSERAQLLQKIHGMFQLLIKHKCLAMSHLNWVIQYALEGIQSLSPRSKLLNLGLDQTPSCICFLGGTQLRKVLKFLQDLSNSSGLSRYSEKSGTGDEKDCGAQDLEIKEMIALGSDSSYLRLDERLIRGEVTSFRCSEKSCSASDDIASVNDGEDTIPLDSDALLSWIFSGPSSGEQLVSWTRMKEENTQRGREILEVLEKELNHLQGLCERKCEHMSYEEALQLVESLCHEELKKREHTTRFASRSYEAVLRKRQEELIERENDYMFISSRLELDAISNILKEAQALNITPFGYEEAFTDVTTRLCDTEYMENDDWRMQDIVHQADSCVEVAIQRQKDHLSVEVSKIDATIMRDVTGMQQLEFKLGPLSTYDFRAIILPLVKSFMRARLEELAEKDATEKSEAAREAFLAELALDAIKNKGGDHSKQLQEKYKDKKKSKDYRKTKGLKVHGGNDQLLYEDTTGEVHLSIASDSHPNLEVEDGVSGDDLIQQKEDLRYKLELEAEERKLEQTLDYQRKIEKAAKQRHLAELHKKDSERMQENIPVSFQGDGGSPNSSTEVDHCGSLSEVSLFNSQKNEPDMPQQYSAEHDMVVTSEVGGGLSKYPENSHQISEDHSLGKTDLLEGIPVVPPKVANGVTVPSKSIGKSESGSIKTTNNQTQIKVGHGLDSQGTHSNGYLRPSRGNRRRGKQRNRSTLVDERSSRSLSSEKHNREPAASRNKLTQRCRVPFILAMVMQNQEVME